MATIPIVNTQDKRIGLITSVVSMLLVLILMWLIKYEVVDPPPEDMHLETATELDKTVIEDIIIAGGGGGDPSNDPVNNTQTTENIITNNNSDVTVNSGNANTTNSPNSDSPPSGNNVDNPFGDGGFGGGTGGGNGSGDGSGIGNDSGPGTGGPGNGGSVDRKVLSHVNSDDIHYNYDAKFYFKVGVNADGYVVDVQNIKSKTTTSDEVIIRKVMALVKNQVRFSKAPGATIQTLAYNVSYKAI
ncbi:MAG: hypothetical protein NXI10_16435 [bacterium]|nr:hypothetical protein [bacterium]